MVATPESDPREGRKPSVSFTPEPAIIKITSEPYVVLTQRGYAPVVDVDVEGEPEPRMMYISAASLSQALEDFRLKNSDKFKGIHIKIRKESADRFAKYIVEAVK